MKKVNEMHVLKCFKKKSMASMHDRQTVQYRVKSSC